MRKASFNKNYIVFEKQLDWYGKFLDSKNPTSPTTPIEYQEMLEAFVFKIAAKWGVLVSQITITSLNRDSSKYSKILGLKLRKNLTRDESEAILIGHRYIDFRSVDDIKSFAKKHLVDKYNPFKFIPSSDAKKINHFFTIRNYLAHYSSFSRRKYEAMLTKEYSLRKNFEPGLFLSKINKKSKKYRWVEFIESFLRTSRAMNKIH